MFLWIFVGALLSQQLNALRFCIDRKGIDGSGYVVVAGTSFIREGPSMQVKKLKHFTVHPKYGNYEKRIYDTAIIVLESKLTYNVEVQPLMVVSTNKHSAMNAIWRLMEETSYCLVLGWGEEAFGDEKKKPTKRLKGAKVRLIENEDCEKDLGKVLFKNKQICVTGNSSVPFLGDSGGPLVCQEDVYGVLSRVFPQYETTTTTDLAVYSTPDILLHFLDYGKDVRADVKQSSEFCSVCVVIEGYLLQKLN